MPPQMKTRDEWALVDDEGKIRATFRQKLTAEMMIPHYRFNKREKLRVVWLENYKKERRTHLKRKIKGVFKR